jgi:hypothetical protein
LIRISLALFAGRIQHEQLMAKDKGTQGLVTLVCLTCGNEKFFDKAVPNAVSCEKCGGTVFRTFATPTEPDDATIATLEEQARSIGYGDASPDTGPGDVRDLDMR